MKLSGLAKYIYSKTHGLCFCLGKGLTLLNKLFSIITISPFSTSLIKVAPTISKAHVSEASMNVSLISQLQGLIPNGSSHQSVFC